MHNDITALLEYSQKAITSVDHNLLVEIKGFLEQTEAYKAIESIHVNFLCILI